MDPIEADQVVFGYAEVQGTSVTGAWLLSADGLGPTGGGEGFTAGGGGLHGLLGWTSFTLSEGIPNCNTIKDLLTIIKCIHQELLYSGD